MIGEICLTIAVHLQFEFLQLSLQGLVFLVRSHQIKIAAPNVPYPHYERETQILYLRSDSHHQGLKEAHVLTTMKIRRNVSEVKEKNEDGDNKFPCLTGHRHLGP